jgi:type III restriction enzyme
MSMKFHFDDSLPYQRAAIDAVSGVFAGQEILASSFSVMARPHSLEMEDGSDLGVGNHVGLISDEILANLRTVQLENGLPQEPQLLSRNFTVEMETGTGKTYVYLRSIFELNRLYGFTKFIIIVPSIAIKAGVNKSIDMLKEHFARLYDNVPIHSFLYDSGALGQIRNFATSNQIEVMVITVAAMNKNTNKIWEKAETLGWEAPIDLIKATSPIVIIDEPQSVYGGKKASPKEGQGRKAIESLGALATFRYSATHDKADRGNMIYRLNAMDAYAQKLVKQIEVASLSVEASGTVPYIRLLAVRNRSNKVEAQLELEIENGQGVAKKKFWVDGQAQLDAVTSRTKYDGYNIENIYLQSGQERITVSLLEDDLSVGESTDNAIEDIERVRLKLQKTIEEHFEKELSFKKAKRGLKVLSLFFIDEVAKYRYYDDDGQQQGPYAVMFEQEFIKLAKSKKFSPLFDGQDLTDEARAAHNGYFSIDKNKRFVETSESSETGRQAAAEGYRLIMTDKERLTSFETKLRFLFSHSALKEGWDNPNVFQICTLRNLGTETQRRQTIGRGLRLAVDQDGTRIQGHEVNRLTVIADESFADFAENLQREFEDDLGIRFGIVLKEAFAQMTTVNEFGDLDYLGAEASHELWKLLQEMSYVDAAGKVQDDLRNALFENAVVVPAEFQEFETQILSILRNAAGRVAVVNKQDARRVQPKEAVLQSEDFKSLWNRVKTRTTYNVDFKTDDLVSACVTALKENLSVPRRRVAWGTTRITEINEGGLVTAKINESNARDAVLADFNNLPDLLTELQNRTSLTRKSLARILRESGKLAEFSKNPEAFIQQASSVINKAKQHALIDGISYQKRPEAESYSQELFRTEELKGYLKTNILVGDDGEALELTKSVFEYLVADSDVERKFAKELESRSEIKVFTKLPDWFKIPTPLGSYNPDWAVLVEESNGSEKLYFVVETKGTSNMDSLRTTEKDKIKAAQAHFAALNAGLADSEKIGFAMADTMSTFEARWDEAWA